MKLKIEELRNEINNVISSPLYDFEKLLELSREFDRMAIAEMEERLHTCFNI